MHAALLDTKARAVWCSFDLAARPWDLPAYIGRQVTDAVHVVAQALDSIITRCEDPSDARLLGGTIRSSSFKSQSGPPDRIPSISFDSQGRRIAALNLGNLVGGTWVVAGTFSPGSYAAMLNGGMAFSPNGNVMRWPRTTQTPRDWFECAGGEQFAEVSNRQLASCVKCKAGTFRTFRSLNSSCIACSAGVLLQASRGRSGRVGRVCLCQAFSNPRRAARGA
jgi:hypothetical protein